ncbi:MAG: hypothetical protein KGL53_09770 [Elusimicrobia bacterium]|nr:hypothetical protein [Elusimicrobiota bacterium]
MKTLGLALLLCAAPAAAGPLSLSLDTGAGLPLGSSQVRRDSQVGPTLEGMLRWGFSKDLDAALSYGSVQMYKTRHTRLEPFLLSLIRSWGPRAGWTPEARLGAGTAVVHDARADQAGSYATFALRSGAGLERALGPRAAVGAWADYLFAAKGNSATTDVHAALFTLSLRWLGGPLTERPQAETPAEPLKPAFAPPAPAAPTPPAVEEPDAVTP